MNLIELDYTPENNSKGFLLKLPETFCCYKNINNDFENEYNELISDLDFYNEFNINKYSKITFIKTNDFSKEKECLNCNIINDIDSYECVNCGSMEFNDLNYDRIAFSSEIEKLELINFNELNIGMESNILPLLNNKNLNNNEYKEEWNKWAEKYFKEELEKNEIILYVQCETIELIH